MTWRECDTGQFLSLDPLEAVTGAPYACTGNNPLSRTDPFGTFNVGAGLKRMLTTGAGKHISKAVVEFGRDVLTKKDGIFMGFLEPKP